MVDPRLQAFEKCRRSGKPWEFKKSRPWDGPASIPFVYDDAAFLANVTCPHVVLDHVFLGISHPAGDRALNGEIKIIERNRLVLLILFQNFSYVKI